MICKKIHDVASQAFERMDVQLDFDILFKITDVLKFSKEEYLQSEDKEIFQSLEEMERFGLIHLHHNWIRSLQKL